jgi:4-hydroxybenzoate polyprenyltransferase
VYKQRASLSWGDILLKETSLPNQAGISRVNLFLALSRTPHMLLDLASPGLAAILCLHAFPSLAVLVLGFITAFAGYTAVYALNDVIDYRVDQEVLHSNVMPDSKADLDSFFVRHPLAQGMLSYREGIFWTFGWAGLALVGAFFLNPVGLVIFVSAALLEIAYCYLLKITHLRSIISGVVKTSGPVAAVFAVNPDPSVSFLVTLFVWLFSWEIGGQNVPNDWADLETDQKLKARTIPVRFGSRGSILIILSSLLLSLVMSVAMYWVSPKPLNTAYLAGALIAGYYFLLVPGYRLYRTNASQDASLLFNRASYYPLFMLLVTMLSWFV